MSTHKSPLVPAALLVFTTLGFFSLSMGIGSLYHSIVDWRALAGYILGFSLFAFGVLRCFGKVHPLWGLFLGFVLFCMLLTGLRYFGPQQTSYSATILNGDIKTNLSDGDGENRFKERYLVLNVVLEDGQKLRLVENRPGLTRSLQIDTLEDILENKPPLTVYFEESLPGVRLYLKHVIGEI